MKHFDGLANSLKDADPAGKSKILKQIAKLRAQNPDDGKADVAADAITPEQESEIRSILAKAHNADTGQKAEIRAKLEAKFRLENAVEAE